MTTALRIEDAWPLVRSRRTLLGSGWRERDIARAVDEGHLRRLQRNRYVSAELWRSIWPEDRHLLEVAAAWAEVRDGTAVVSHISAAVIHGLPLYRHSPQAVHLIVPGPARMSSRHTLMRHSDALSDADIRAAMGVRCTTLERTVFDVARTVEPDAALVIADAALRREAFVGRRYDEDRAAQWRARMEERLSTRPGQRGLRRACEIVAGADGRSESPGESVARRRWRQLGYSDLLVQPEIRLANGAVYRADLAVPALEALFEFDGQGKYRDAELRGDGTVEEVVLAEKRREDRLRAATSWRVIRADAEDIRTVESFAALLETYSIRPHV